MNIEKANDALHNAGPVEIIEWVVANSSNPITTTSFGPYSAVMLHMATQAKADMPIIWVDSGYNTRQTYKVVEQLIERLQLNLHVYTPKVSAARRDAALGGVPDLDSEEHAEFTEQFKLEPFNRAMREHQPDVWLTAVRSEETAFRKSMKIVNEGPNGVVKVAPLLHWTEQDLQDYIDEHGLPNAENYFDPTKGLNNRECGLHTRL